MVCRHRLGEPEPSGLPDRCPWRVFGGTSHCAWRPGDRGVVRLVDCSHGGTPEVIGVSIEMTQGPVVEALLERGFCVYGINPKQLDRFRDRFTVAGAKDDRRDAHVLADSLRTDRHAFRRLSTAEPVIVKLREWSRMADELH